MDADGFATTTHNNLSSDVDAASDTGAASGCESEDGQLDSDRLDEDDDSSRVWFALIEYFFKVRGEDKLRVHLSWCVLSSSLLALADTL